MTWYGRTFELDPLAVQLRLHIDVPKQRRPQFARLFQVPGHLSRGDSPLWQHVEEWAYDPDEAGPLRNVDDALCRLIAPLMQQRLPGID